MNHMLKSILLRSLHLPERVADGDPAEQVDKNEFWQLRELAAFAKLCMPSNPEETWPVGYGGQVLSNAVSRSS